MYEKKKIRKIRYRKYQRPDEAITRVADFHFSQSIGQATEEICSFMWQDDEPVDMPVNVDGVQRNAYITLGIVEDFCKKGGKYREIFTFSYGKRFDFMEKRLRIPGYECRYFDNLNCESPKAEIDQLVLTRFPKLQFRVVDHKEVIFASRGYGDSLSAYVDKDLASIMECYFDLAWDRAIPIPKDGSTLTELKKKVDDYQNRP